MQVLFQKFGAKSGYVAFQREGGSIFNVQNQFR